MPMMLSSTPSQRSRRRLRNIVDRQSQGGGAQCDHHGELHEGLRVNVVRRSASIFTSIIGPNTRNATMAPGMKVEPKERMKNASTLEQTATTKASAISGAPTRPGLAPQRDQDVPRNPDLDEPGNAGSDEQGRHHRACFAEQVDAAPSFPRRWRAPSRRIPPGTGREQASGSGAGCRSSRSGSR